MLPEEQKKSVIVDKIGAAQAQLEGAIWLWFNTSDVVAIRTLARAAHDCYHALCVHHGAPSILAEFIASQSKAFQKRHRDVENFLKHGRRELKGKVRIDVIVAEVMLFECVSCHKDLMGRNITPVMRLYTTRFLLEHPEVMLPEDRETFLAGLGRNELGEIEALKMSRAEAFCYLLAILEKLPTELPP